MNHTVMLAVLSTLDFGLAACSSSSTTVNNADIIGSDLDAQADTRDTVGNDTSDVNRPDTVITDTVVTDTVVTDTVVTDTVVTDTVVTDTVVTDTVVTDTVVTDTVVTDTVDPACSGACDPATQSTKCLADGTSLCFCDSSNSTWTPYVCADVCTSNGMAGTQCGATANGDDCTCVNDCTNATLVATQCKNAVYTECTCASADPCAWLADGYCDSACAQKFPADHYTDTADCTCSGACDAAQFAEFCTLDSKDCTCGTDSQMAVQDCTVYCGTLGATTGTCDGLQATCVCADYVCTDAAKVQAQCTAGIYTACTCAAADPCAWINDTTCDSPSCNKDFPTQTNFDDSASAACTAG